MYLTATSSPVALSRSRRARPKLPLPRSFTCWRHARAVASALAKALPARQRATCLLKSRRRLDHGCCGGEARRSAGRDAASRGGRRGTARAACAGVAAAQGSPPDTGLGAGARRSAAPPARTDLPARCGGGRWTTGRAQGRTWHSRALLLRYRVSRLAPLTCSCSKLGRLCVRRGAGAALDARWSLMPPRYVRGCCAAPRRW